MEFWFDTFVLHRQRRIWASNIIVKESCLEWQIIFKRKVANAWRFLNAEPSNEVTWSPMNVLLQWRYEHGSSISFHYMIVLQSRGGTWSLMWSCKITSLFPSNFFKSGGTKYILHLSRHFTCSSPLSLRWLWQFSYGTIYMLHHRLVLYTVHHNYCRWKFSVITRIVCITLFFGRADF